MVGPWKKPCIPWHPIPEAANEYTALSVVQFAYHLHQPLSLIVVAPWGPPGEEERDVAWRLSFPVIRGFRVKPLGSWAGATAPPWPLSRQGQAPGWNGPAMWEITASPFLDECSAPHERGRWHHYVIADFDETYEIVASGWAAELLHGVWEDHLQDMASQ